MNSATVTAELVPDVTDSSVAPPVHGAAELSAAAPKSKRSRQFYLRAIVGIAFAVLCVRTVTVWTWQGESATTAGIGPTTDDGPSAGVGPTDAGPTYAGQTAGATLNDPTIPEPSAAVPADPPPLAGAVAETTPLAGEPKQLDNSIVTESSGPESAEDHPQPVVQQPAVGLVIRNPRGSQVTLHFAVGREVICLAEGEQREFQPDETLSVRFDRGGSFGKAKLSLDKGTFEFRVGDSGWDLLPVAPQDQPQR